MEPLDIDGCWVYTPRTHPDDRGEFLEALRGGELADAVGRPFELAQANCAVSRRAVLRGIHYADVPPGQAKYVICTTGAVLDVVVDIRVGSPTYARWVAVRLDDRDRRAVYLAEGLGHAFMALTDAATVFYLCSRPYTPEREHAVNPLDPRLGIGWPDDLCPLLSDRDAAAPTLEEAERSGLLPSYADCAAYYRKLRRRPGG